jgi:ectoine hydroxylase-related dioxygenase (phytanoyl-CoA dioxygenase family)
MKFKKVELINDKVVLFNLKQAALSSIDSLYFDYFNNESYASFEENHLYNEAVIMKAAAYRFATPEVISQLFSAAVKAGGYTEDEYVSHPVFYMRVSKPTMNIIANNNAILDTQPHYDRSFGIFSYSFWLAIEDATVDTGGLCFFDDSVEHIFNIDWNSPNKYNYDKYLLNYEDIDRKIKNHIVYPDLKAGSAYMFDSNTLHAATKARTAVRLSFDFRIAEKAKVKELENRSKDIFNAYNSNIALSNAKNLMLLGDYIGANRLASKYFLDMSILNKLTACTDILMPKNKLAWRTEYSWIDQDLSN